MEPVSVLFYFYFIFYFLANQSFHYKILDIDECDLNSTICDGSLSGSSCLNTIGSFICYDETSAVFYSANPLNPSISAAYSNDPDKTLAIQQTKIDTLVSDEVFIFLFIWAAVLTLILIVVTIVFLVRLCTGAGGDKRNGLSSNGSDYMTTSSPR